MLLSGLRPVWTIDPDAAAYLSLARSLASGGGYALDGVPHAKYPPGLPLVQAAVIRATDPEAYRLLGVVAVACFLAGLALAAALIRRLGYAPWAVLTVVAATGLSQPFFDLTVVYLRSEPLFLFMTLAALLGQVRALRSDGRPVDMALAAAATMAAILTRMAGVALVVPPLLRLVQPSTPARTRGRALVLVIAALLPVALWQMRAADLQAALPGAADYGNELLAAEPRDLTKTVRTDMPRLDGPAMAARVAGNLEVLARATAVLTTNVERASHRLPVGALLLAVLMVGLVAQARAGGARRDVAVYVAATLGLYLIWPFNQQERFYAPLLPLLLLATGEGVVTLWRGAGRLAGTPGGRRSLLAAGAVVLIVLALQRSDHPRLLGRWSYSYAGMLAILAIALLGAAVLLRRRTWPALDPRLGLGVALMFGVSFAGARFVEWPARLAEFESRRAAAPEVGPLQRIDVHPVLEDVARFLQATPRDTVMMVDVPKIMTVLSGRRCIPIVYSQDPPHVRPGEADYLYYTGEIPAVAAIADDAAGPFETAHEVKDASGAVVGRILRMR